MFLMFLKSQKLNRRKTMDHRKMEVALLVTTKKDKGFGHVHVELVKASPELK